MSYIAVRQGKQLSPLLFSLHVNDIEGNLLEKNCNYLKFDKWLDEMLKVLVLIYADDTVIMADIETGLCNALRAMGKYCDKWKLEINFKKK